MRWPTPLRQAAGKRVFWYLFATFFVCGFTTNGLIGTHLIALCGDHGMPEVQAAGLLAIMGIFDLFGTTAGKFRMTYPFSEQATVVSGEVRLTDESTGQSTLYKAGDSWFVTKGTPVLWEVVSESFVKHYFAVV